MKLGGSLGVDSENEMGLKTEKTVFDGNLL